MMTLETELQAARGTISRLNRRVQKAASLIAQLRVVDGRPTGGARRSLGRALANYAAATYQAELEEVRAELADTRKHLREANKGAEINAHINQSLTAKLLAAQHEMARLRMEMDGMCSAEELRQARADLDKDKEAGRKMAQMVMAANSYGVRLMAERDGLRSALRGLCDALVARMAAEDASKHVVPLMEAHKRARAVLAGVVGGGDTAATDGGDFDTLPGCVDGGDRSAALELFEAVGEWLVADQPRSPASRRVWRAYERAAAEAGRPPGEVLP